MRRKKKKIKTTKKKTPKTPKITQKRKKKPKTQNHRGGSQESDRSKIPMTQTLVEMTLMAQQGRGEYVSGEKELPSVTCRAANMSKYCGVPNLQNHARHNYIHQMFRSILILSVDLRSS